MQKKLLAAAVGSALGAVAAPSFAQNATVNVYGALVAEYASIRHGQRNATDSYQNIDQWQNPGSAIGFRGEEKLGGGLSAWFQCETTMDYRGSNNSTAGGANSSQAQGLCSRDSALGIKGGFGNVFMGNWGMPLKRVTNDLVGAEDTGVYGVGRLLYGNSSTYGTTAPNAAAGTGDGRLNAGAWRRRQSNLVGYDTPVFSGFQGMFAYTTANMATGATSAQLKPRLWGLGVTYNNGPIALGFGYEKHKDMYGTVVAGWPAGSGACAGSDERAWALTGSYTFSNNLKLGAQYTRQTANSAVTQSDVRVNAWMVGMDWKISGPHGVRANYTRAGDVTGGVTAAGALGISTPARPAAAALASGGFTDTGANQWSIRYVHQLSKRTEATIGYVRLDNKRNANYELGGTNTTVLAGSDSNAVAIGMKHSF